MMLPVSHIVGLAHASVRLPTCLNYRRQSTLPSESYITFPSAHILVQL